MKQEYMNKLELAKKLLVWDTTLPEEELHKNVDKGCDLLEELVTIQDTDVLVGLLEFFTDENEDYGGVCERLENDIYENFTIEQIVYALEKKLEYLIKNDVSRLAAIIRTIFYEGYFINFRNTFNNVSSKLSYKILTELDNWCDDEFEEERNILREDMKKW